jgi:uncharacterized protein YjbI with pentapeptide repeats
MSCVFWAEKVLLRRGLRSGRDRAIAQQSRVHSDFTGSDFSDSIVHSCEFKGIFDDAVFSGAKSSEATFTRTSFRNCDVTDTEFKWCRFNKAELGGTSFDHAAVVDCEFFECAILD